MPVPDQVRDDGSGIQYRKTIKNNGFSFDFAQGGEPVEPRVRHPGPDSGPKLQNQQMGGFSNYDTASDGMGRSPPCARQLRSGCGRASKFNIISPLTNAFS